MKKTLLSLIICIPFIPCEKEPNNNPTNDPISLTGSIQYKVNGDLVVMDNINVLTGQYVIFAKQLKGSIIPETRYLLNAQKGANNILIMTIVTDSLQLVDYNYQNANNANLAFVLNYNGQNAAIFFNGDFFNVKISEYKNSLISGTFNAKLSPHSLPDGVDSTQQGTMLITEGKINNVQVVY